MFFREGKPMMVSEFRKLEIFTPSVTSWAPKFTLNGPKFTKTQRNSISNSVWIFFSYFFNLGTRITILSRFYDVNDPLHAS